VTLVVASFYLVVVRIVTSRQRSKEIPFVNVYEAFVALMGYVIVL